MESLRWSINFRTLYLFYIFKALIKLYCTNEIPKYVTKFTFKATPSKDSVFSAERNASGHSYWNIFLHIHIYFIVLEGDMYIFYRKWHYSHIFELYFFSLYVPLISFCGGICRWISLLKSSLCGRLNYQSQFFTSYNSTFGPHPCYGHRVNEVYYPLSWL